MAISRIAGQMLTTTLERDGVNLSFSNLGNSTPVLFLDVGNNRVGVNNSVANVTLDVAGNIAANNLSLTGNVTVANVNATAVSASGNVTGGNLITSGLLTATGNITAGNINTAGLITATGNITSGNVLSSGIVSATGNGTFGNVDTGTVSASANVVAGNVLVGNILIPSTGNISVANVNINNLAEPFANTDAATKFYVDTTNAASWGNLYVSNTTITTSLANGNITLASTGTELVQVAGTAGFTVPVGNTDQRPNPVATGTIRFNTSSVQLEVWDGSQWSSASGDIAVITNQTVNGDGSTLQFALDQPATAESILVTINGVSQTPGVDYTTSSSPDIITFTTAPAAGDVIQIRFIAATSVLAGLINGTSNVAIPVSSGNITISSGGIANILNITSGGLAVTGNCSISGLSIVNPNYISVSSTGTTETLSSTTTVNFLLVANAGYTTTVNMPTAPVDGQVVEFAISNNSVTLVAGTGTLNSSFAGVTSVGSGFKYVYRASNTTWYRLQ